MAGTSRDNNNHLLVDDFYFSALFDEDEIFPISDEKYAEELQLQEALVPSSSRKRIQTLETEHQDKVKSRKSNESSLVFCTICMDAKPKSEMFENNTCTHLFCSDCIAKHVAVKIQENIWMVKCPELNCEGVFQPEACRSIIPKLVFDRWENALCDSVILASQKFYCPFKDCSAVLVDDGGEVVTVSECPNCRRLFCAQCNVSWHDGMECVEFQGLSKGGRESEDLMAMELAKKKKWRRCPNCKFYVEKDDGCLHITCRCGFHFCYRCGSKWTESHYGCN
ncbi:unnamed protein product [Camellia sinensis]